MSMFTYVINILISLMMVSMTFVMLIMSRASGERISEVLTEKPDLFNVPHRGMVLAGGCGDTNGKPQIDKTSHLQAAYEFGKNIYSE